MAGEEYVYSLFRRNEMAIQVVWLKRDLRIRDHEPLVRAAEAGPVCALYIYEPGLWAQPEMDAAHLHFVEQSLEELDLELQERGSRLTRRVGRAVHVLRDLHAAFKGHGGIGGLWSHRETGLMWTYSRDRAVREWCKEHGVLWAEFGQDGVCRPHPSRDGWAGRWTKCMSRPVLSAPTELAIPEDLSSAHDYGRPPNPEDLGLDHAAPPNLQPAGSRAADELLRSFLEDRGRDYRYRLSSPLTAPSACSRLSTHLAWGTISTRRVWQRTRLSIRSLSFPTRQSPAQKGFVQDLEAFEGRLRWRGHFMQKLEDEPGLQYQNLNRTLDGLRENNFRDELFEAWSTGHTGWPMVDACMRSLRSTRWLNFRMRAMLVSISSYPLWLHWRRPAIHLARHFLDFEPGIHFSQVQMQAGTTGINRLRVYDPVKQAVDHDPQGEFIRRWIPELAGVPTNLIHQPHRMSGADQAQYGCRIGTDYPAPLVDFRAAAHLSKARLEKAMRSDASRAQSRLVHQKHGSRMPASRRRWR